MAPVKLLLPLIGVLAVLFQSTSARVSTVTRAVSTYPDSLPLSGALRPSIHDPSEIVKSPDGKTFLLYGTGKGIRIRTSKDMVHWEDAGLVFPDGTQPKATFDWTAGDKILWAPSVSYHDGKFHLYYSASKSGSDKGAIFYATSQTGLSGSWTDKGMVISSGGTGYICIDASLAIDLSGNVHLVFGSQMSGIYLLEINRKTGLAKNAKNPRSGLKHLAELGGVPNTEASYLFKYAGWWWLFNSWGSCCSGPASDYNVRVARSRSIYGPFKDKSGKPSLQGGGTLILASHAASNGQVRYSGTGGQSVFKHNGRPMIIYHYSGLNVSDYLIGLNYLDFSSGWPVVVAK
ncbi:Arabinanase/levansucrase/invertase [Meredithblackwellia eburnea MCA 4105]